MSPHEIAVICRFTRNGAIPWQSVAVMLGRDRGALRAEWEAVASTPVSLEPDSIGPVGRLPEPESYRSTRAKGPGLRELLLVYLAKRSEAVDVLSAKTQRSPESIRMRLSQMQADGLVQHDNRAGRAVGRTWSLTVFGREVYDRERQHGEAA